MNREQIISNLCQASKELFGYGVIEIGLFGSYVRNENNKDSDIDLLIDFAKGEETFDNFLAATELLENLFEGYKVEVGTKKGLSLCIGPHVLKEVEYAKVA